MERLRWPQGIVCRACGERRGWRTGAGRWWVCAGCSLSRVPDVSAASLIPFVQASVEPGATVMTDGWSAYGALPLHGYTHTKKILSASGDPAHVSMPAVHRVSSLLKRWLLGTYQGSVAPEHLDAYLNEFTFRFNRRTSRRRGLLFHRLLEQAVITPPTTYKQTIQRGRRRP